jgi:hypothetical protein
MISTDYECHVTYNEFAAQGRELHKLKQRRQILRHQTVNF